MEIRVRADEEGDGIVDCDTVGFFDLLARFDYEDQQREKSALKTDPPRSAPGCRF